MLCLCPSLIPSYACFRDGSAARLQWLTCFRESQPLFVRCHVPQTQKCPQTRWRPEQEQSLMVRGAGMGPSQWRAEVLSAHTRAGRDHCKQVERILGPEERENR